MSKKLHIVSEELQERIEEYIWGNNLQPGDKLPSERDLCEIFDANRVTLREALNRMQNEGIIDTLHGKGRYVAPKKLQDNVHAFISFSAGWAEEQALTESKVISFELVEASKKVAGALCLPTGMPVYCLKRVRFVNNIALCLETAYIPTEHCPGLLKYDFGRESLYDILATDYNVHLTRQEHVISIAILDAEEAELLETKAGDAAVFIKGTTSKDGITYEYCESLYVAIRYSMCGKLGPAK